MEIRPIHIGISASGCTALATFALGALASNNVLWIPMYSYAQITLIFTICNIAFAIFLTLLAVNCSSKMRPRIRISDSPSPSMTPDDSPKKNQIEGMRRSQTLPVIAGEKHDDTADKTKAK